MYTVELLLPLSDNAGRRLGASRFKATSVELTERFGGLTAHSRAPVDGLWSKGAKAKRDTLLILEVNVPRLNRRWWGSYRKLLERRFRQQEIQITATRITRL